MWPAKVAGWIVREIISLQNVSAKVAMDYLATRYTIPLIGRTWANTTLCQRFIGESIVFAGPDLLIERMPFSPATLSF